MSGHPITEDDLEAYVDEVLDPARQALVVAYLEAHPDVAKRVARYIEQRDGLRMAFATIAGEPVPPELNLARMIEAKRGRLRQLPAAGAWWLAVVAVVLLGLGGVGGWLLRRVSEPAAEGIAALAREAVDSYDVYAPDRLRPVEIRAGERAALVEWASARLRRPVAVPDLAAAGYRFMGGRVVVTSHGPAVLFMYDDDRGTRLVMLTRPMLIDRDAPMSEHSRGSLTGFAWADAGVGYTLFGEAPADILQPLADAARKQLVRDT